jgi:hypothetical protein
MKIFQALVSALVGGFVLTLAVGAHAQSTAQYVTVVRIQGEARYSPDNGTTYHPLVVGKILGPGNVIQSAAHSTVDLVIGDKVVAHIAPVPDRVGLAADSPVRGLVSYKAEAAQNVIRMKGDTVLAIDILSASNTGADKVTDTELDLRQGTIMGSVKKLSAESKYLIKIPNGMAAIRGTTFILSANGAITVTDGSALISFNGQPAQTINAGQQFDPTTGQITTLTPEALSNAEQTAVVTVTLEEGIISFANDKTTVYVSPNRVGGGAAAPAPPPPSMDESVSK